ncbi:MAG: hypothetical protein ACREAS_03120, partial [Nitrososphaera sp.]
GHLIYIHVGGEETRCLGKCSAASSSYYPTAHILLRSIFTTPMLDRLRSIHQEILAVIGS